MIKDPKMLPIPAPDPATPTVAAPAPMNLAAESMSLETAEVWIARIGAAETKLCSEEGLANRALLTGRRYICDRGAN